MQDGLPLEYDSWRLSNAEDEAEIRETRRLREEYTADRADYLRDRAKDEPTIYDDFEQWDRGSDSE